jgi:hypothetical protein
MNFNRNRCSQPCPNGRRHQCSKPVCGSEAHNAPDHL